MGLFLRLVFSYGRFFSTFIFNPYFLQHNQKHKENYGRLKICVSFMLDLFLAFLFGVSYSLINVRFIRREDDVIEIYRNKRKPIRRIKEIFKNEDGCIACCLFDVCLDWTGRRSSTCEVMEQAGVIMANEEGDRFFVDI